MSLKREEELDADSEKAVQRLRIEAANYAAMAEPLVMMEYMFFRTCIQEAHLYALIDQLGTGKMDAAEHQRRFKEHANRIAGGFQIRRAASQIAKIPKAN